MYVTITNVRSAPTSLYLGIGEGQVGTDIEVIDVESGESIDSDGYMMNQAVYWSQLNKTVTFAFSRIHGYQSLKKVTMVVDGIQYIF